MQGEQRRKEIMEQIQNSSTPVSGTALARNFQVSRQIIVQDIALLRAAGYDIISTRHGYLCRVSPVSPVSRVFYVKHSSEQIEEELNLMADCGCTVVDVYVEHSAYGKISASLNIHSRRQVKEFLQKIKSGQSEPLTSITHGYHYHTVQADSEETLDALQEELAKAGFLA